MADPVRVTHAGTDILVPEGDYALLDEPGQLGLALDEVEAQAREHGAVAFEVSYGDAWEPAILIHVASARTRLDVHGAFRAHVFTSPDRPFVVLVPDHWSEGVFEVPRPEFLVRVDGAWECATWRLTPELPDLRDWAWRWPRSWTDCGVLKLGVQRSAEELAAFVASPLYERIEARRFRVPMEPANQRSMHEITVDDGALWLWRGGWSTPIRQIAATELALLDRILRGELGDAWWDLWDTDYQVIMATGDDLASLGAYLARDCDVARLDAHTQLVMREHVCEATEATTTDEVLAMIPHAPRSVTIRMRDALVGDLRWLRPLAHPRQLVRVQGIK